MKKGTKKKARQLAIRHYADGGPVAALAGSGGAPTAPGQTPPPGQVQGGQALNPYALAGLGGALSPSMWQSLGYQPGQYAVAPQYLAVPPPAAPTPGTTGQSWNEQTGQWQAAPYGPMDVQGGQALQQPVQAPSFNPQTGQYSNLTGRYQPYNPGGQGGFMPGTYSGRYLPFSGNRPGMPAPSTIPGPQPPDPGAQGSQGGGNAGGSFSDTGSVSPGPGATGIPSLSTSLVGLTNAALGTNFNSPFDISISPFGAGPTANLTSNPQLDSTITAAGKSLFSGLTGMPTGISTAGLLSALSPALAGVMGPLGMAYGMFNTAVNLGTLGVNAAGVPTTQQSLQHAQNLSALANDPDPSAAAQYSGQNAAITADFAAAQNAAAQGLGYTFATPEAAAQAAISGIGGPQFSSAAGYGFSAPQLGPQGAGFGLSDSNPGVQQGFALNNPGVGALTNALSAPAQSLADMTTAGIFGGPASTRGDTGGVSLSDAGRGVDVDLEPNEATAGQGPGIAGPGNISQGGIPGTTGVGQANDAATSEAAADAAAAAAAAAATADAAAAASGTGGGGGSDGGGCYLGTWSMVKSGDPKKAKLYKTALERFKREFMKKDPQHAQALFTMYQRTATQIIEAAERKGPQTVQWAKNHLQDALLHRTHLHMKTKNVEEAVKNLIAVLTRMAQQLGVGLPQGRFIPLGR